MSGPPDAWFDKRPMAISAGEYQHEQDLHRRELTRLNEAWQDVLREHCYSDEFISCYCQDEESAGGMSMNEDEWLAHVTALVQQRREAQ